MNKLTGMVTVLLTCGIILSACGISGKTQNSHTQSDQIVSNNKNSTLGTTGIQELLNSVQESVKSTIGQKFLTIKTEDGTAYTWDKGSDRDELQGEIDSLLASLKVKKVGNKEQPSPFVAMLFQNTSVIIPYGVTHPEKNIVIESDEGTFLGVCPAEEINGVLAWLKNHKVKIGK